MHDSHFSVWVVMAAFWLALLALGAVWWPRWADRHALVVEVQSRWLLWGGGALLMVVSSSLYIWTGRPQTWMDAQMAASVRPEIETSLAPIGGASSADVSVTQIEAMVSRLAQRLDKTPNDPAGWRMLARSYESLRRFDQAVQAYRRLLAMQPPEADLLVSYAVALGMSQGEKLAGEPEAVLKEALRLDPQHLQALALAGSAALERGASEEAIVHWQKIVDALPPDADAREQVLAQIRQARASAGP